MSPRAGRAPEAGGGRAARHAARGETRIESAPTALPSEVPGTAPRAHKPDRRILTPSLRGIERPGSWAATGRVPATTPPLTANDHDRDGGDP